MAGDKKHIGLAVQVGAAIRGIRKMRKLTLRNVASHPRMNTTVQTVSRLETGSMSLNMEWIEKLAAVLNVPPSLFFTQTSADAVEEFISREVNARLAGWLRAHLAEIEKADK